MENLNPRWAKVVALQKPTEEEQSQWYFQRYIKHLPNGWEMALFDRSWYNRGWVEPVMGFCTKDQYEQFMQDTPVFEKMLIDSWITLVKFYFSVSKATQAERFEARKTNPLKQYKLSPIDQFSQQLWEKYTLAEYNNFKNTHSKHAPWTLINSDDKKQARLNAIKVVLSQFDYEGKISDKLLKIDNKIVYSGKEKVKRLSEEINTKQDLFD
jgi:polyphosphate kinase 2